MKETQKAIDNQQHEPDLKANEYADMHRVFEQGFSHVGSLLASIHKAQHKHVLQDVKTLVPGNDVTTNFNVQSIYVDNGTNSNPITITSTDSRMSYTVAANTQKWVHPLGGRQFFITGAGQCNAKFVDTFLPL